MQGLEGVEVCSLRCHTISVQIQECSKNARNMRRIEYVELHLCRVNKHEKMLKGNVLATEYVHSLHWYTGMDADEIPIV